MTIARPSVSSVTLVDATFSDAFDFPPTWPRIQAGLLIDTPAILASGPTEGFCGHPASAYPFGDASVGDWDRPLLDALLSVWASSTRGQSGAFRLRVSRILEIAYVAMRAPMHNLRSGNDWGIVLALWVSCFETLANTGGSVRFDDVRAAIEAVPWPPRLRRRLAAYEYRSPARRHGSLGPMTRPVQVYARLYRARNMVLHGEPYERNRLEPGRRNPNWGPLHHEAAVVFRCLLLHFLARHGHGEYESAPGAAETRRIGQGVALARTVSARFAHRVFERALGRR